MQFLAFALTLFVLLAGFVPELQQHSVRDPAIYCVVGEVVSYLLGTLIPPGSYPATLCQLFRIIR